VLHSFTELGEDIQAACAPQWVRGAAPFLRQGEDFSCPEPLQFMNRCPWSVIVIFAIQRLLEERFDLNVRHDRMLSGGDTCVDEGRPESA
jgi:hypothetical protein